VAREETKLSYISDFGPFCKEDVSIYWKDEGVEEVASSPYSILQYYP
jgi:hypothetical protein